MITKRTTAEQGQGIDQLQIINTVKGWDDNKAK